MDGENGSCALIGSTLFFFSYAWKKSVGSKRCQINKIYQAGMLTLDDTNNYYRLYTPLRSREKKTHSTAIAFFKKIR
jgi:hypothetical protein